MFGHYVIPSESLSIYPSVCPLVHLFDSALFLSSNLGCFEPIFFRLCINIGIGEGGNRLISLRNNRVMVIGICQNVLLANVYRINGEISK